MLADTPPKKNKIHGYYPEYVRWAGPQMLSLVCGWSQKFGQTLQLVVGEQGLCIGRTLCWFNERRYCVLGAIKVGVCAWRVHLGGTFIRGKDT